MRKLELLWILAFPVYYLINSFRHELAHALAAVLEGARLLALSFMPNSQAGAFWNGALWQGETGWLTAAAPYLLDLITYLVFFYFCMAVPFQHRWVWINLVAIGLVSPLANSGLNYLTLNQDILVLRRVYSPTVVNLFFGATLAFYVAGLALVILFSRTSLPSIPPIEQAVSIPVTGSPREGRGG